MNTSIYISCPIKCTTQPNRLVIHVLSVTWCDIFKVKTVYICDFKTALSVTIINRMLIYNPLVLLQKYITSQCGPRGYPGIICKNCWFRNYTLTNIWNLMHLYIYLTPTGKIIQLKNIDTIADNHYARMDVMLSETHLTKQKLFLSS